MALYLWYNLYPRLGFGDKLHWRAMFFKYLPKKETKKETKKALDHMVQSTLFGKSVK